MSETRLLESPLQAEHEALHARLVGFAGWRMPVQYAGILPEHRATRTGCGVFDISHMGQLFVTGQQARSWLDGQLTNAVEALQPGQCQYTLLLNEGAGVIDDLILYCLDTERYLLIVNASRVEEDADWLRGRLPAEGDVVLRNSSEDYAGLAVQGPDSVAMAAALGEGTPPLPARNHLAVFPVEGGDAFLCRTGYTGEDGFEIFVPRGCVVDYWRRLIALGVTPCGLGARDTLRLEMAYPLNGSDLDPDHTPLEAGLGFFVALSKPAFTGREALLAQKQKGLPRRLVALLMEGSGPPLRAGYPVMDGDEELGLLTSGCLSPSLGRGIALAYLPPRFAKPGETLEVVIRDRRFRVTTVKKPFYRPQT